MMGYDHSKESFIEACGLTKEVQGYVSYNDLEQLARLGAAATYCVIRKADWEKDELFNIRPWLGVTKMIFRQSGKKPSEITEAIERVWHSTALGDEVKTHVIFTVMAALNRRFLVLDNFPEEPTQFTPFIPIDHSKEKFSEALGLGNEFDPSDIVGRLPRDARDVRLMVGALTIVAAKIVKDMDLLFNLALLFELNFPPKMSVVTELLEMLFSVNEGLFIQRFQWPVND